MTTTKKIAVYDTREYSHFLFVQIMSKVLAERGLEIEVVPITGQQIKEKTLSDTDYIGLIMPGRNLGQDYRDELGESGCRAIQEAVQESSLGVMAICAGSYILSKSINWHNTLQTFNRSKVITNEFALFDGKSVGPFCNLWEDGYQGNSPPGTSSGILSAKVVDVAFTSDSSRHNGHAIYWGGGGFVPNPHSSQVMTPLVYHLGNTQVPKVIQDEANNFAPHPSETYDFQSPAAVIEFSTGRHNKIILSNIHPEINSYSFYHLFGRTSRARAHPREFNQNIADLALSDQWNLGLLSHRFLDNCLECSHKSVLSAKKPVAEPFVSG